MRVEHVFGYAPHKEELLESPYSLGSKLKDKATSKVKGVFGGGQTEQGNIESGTQANQLHKQYKQYIGRVAGTNQKFVPAKHLKAFVQKQGLDSSIIDAPDDGMVSDVQAQKYLMMVARRSGEYQGGSESGQGTEQPQRQPRGRAAQARATGGTETDTIHSKPTGGDDIAKLLGGLSDEDRQRLIQYLK